MIASSIGTSCPASWGLYPSPGCDCIPTGVITVVRGAFAASTRKAQSSSARTIEDSPFCCASRKDCWIARCARPCFHVSDHRQTDQDPQDKLGTDKFDFLLQGIPNLVANQESANYGPNYHARSDTFDKVDLQDFRKCIASLAVMAYVLADMPGRL